MMDISNPNRWFWISLLVVLLIGIAPLANPQCTQTARTVSGTSVYDRPPTFFSGTGWQLGNVIGTLPPDTEVRICEEVMAGLFFDKKKWYRIEFGNRQTGWVFAGQLNFSAVRSDEPAFALALITDAMASDHGTSSEGLPGLSKWTMILVALFFVVLGMIGKVAYDELDKAPTLSLRNCLKLGKCVKALIAAPLIFGAFLEVGNFSFQNEIAVVMFLCMAFQNGFFWQTLLPTDKLTPKAS